MYVRYVASQFQTFAVNYYYILLFVTAVLFSVSLLAFSFVLIIPHDWCGFLAISLTNPLNPISAILLGLVLVKIGRVLLLAPGKGRRDDTEKKI